MKGLIYLKENTIKLIISGVLGACLAYFEQLLVPVLVLAFVMLADYCTGIFKAITTNALCSRTGIIGILKKISYLFIVATAMVVDWIVQSGLSLVGIETGFSAYFALLAIIWLIINELISILENVDASGVPVPTFLIKLTGKLKKTIEDKGDADDGNGN